MGRRHAPKGKGSALGPLVSSSGGDGEAGELCGVIELLYVHRRCMDMCIDMCIDVYRPESIDMCIDVYRPESIDMCIQRCRVVHRHVYGHVYRRLYRHVHRHVYRHVHRHLYRYVHRHASAWCCDGLIELLHAPPRCRRLQLPSCITDADCSTALCHDTFTDMRTDICQACVTAPLNSLPRAVKNII